MTEIQPALCRDGKPYVVARRQSARTRSPVLPALLSVENVWEEDRNRFETQYAIAQMGLLLLDEERD